MPELAGSRAPSAWKMVLRLGISCRRGRKSFRLAKRFTSRGSLGSCRKPGGSQQALVVFPVRVTLPASLINSPALAPLLLLAGASVLIPFWTAARYGGPAARISAALWPAINLGALFLFLFLATVLSKPIGAAGAAALAVAAYALMLVHLGALAL